MPMQSNVFGSPVDLSKAVRPFTSPRGAPNRKRTERGLYFGGSTYTPPSTSNPSPDGVLTWSGSQPVQVTTLGSLGIVIKWDDEDDQDFTELTRTTHITRVENPDDPSQYVDVEDTDYIQFKNNRYARPSYLFGAG